MKRKLLLAVDDSRHSRLAAKYASDLFGEDYNVHFDLLNIQGSTAKPRIAGRPKMNGCGAIFGFRAV